MSSDKLFPHRPNPPSSHHPSPPLNLPSLSPKSPAPVPPSAAPFFPLHPLPPVPSSSRPPRPPLPSRTAARPRHFPPSVPRRPRSTSNPYIPPFRQRQLDAAVPSPPPISSQSGQNKVWQNMKKRIIRIVNMVNAENVAVCAKALFRLNLIRARGVFVKTILRHQLASPPLSPVFACLIAIIGSRLPQVAELLVARLIAQLKAAYANQDRVLCFATARFIAHLFNQKVVTDLLLLEFLSTCTLDPSDGSIELAVVTLQECTALLSETSPRSLELIFQRMRVVLHEGDLSKRVQVMIEDLITMRRKMFSSDVTLDPRLDLLDEEDIITHDLTLDDEEDHDLEYEHDQFQFDPDFEENERIYESIKRDILGAEADAPDFLLPISPGNSNVSSMGKAGESDAQTSEIALVTSTPSKESNETVKDMTEAETLEFRRTVYLTITSALSAEELAHKLTLVMRKNPGRELELCQFIIQYCSQEKTFIRTFGLLGQRFCLLDSVYVSKFEELFATHYATIQQYKSRNIRNIANFYAFLFAKDALPWSTFQIVRIVESETTVSSRIFLKQLLQEIAKTMGRARMKKYFLEHSARGNLDGLLPTDNVENAKFAIEFFKAIDLGYLCEGLEGKLATLPQPTQPEDDDADDSSSVSSSISSDSASSSSLSDSSGIGDADVGSFGGIESYGSARDGQRVPSESGSKRVAEESSLDPSHRPIKLRRRTFGVAEASEDRRSPADVGDDSGSNRINEEYSRRRKRDYSKRSDDDRYSRDQSVKSDGSRSGVRRHGIVSVVGPRQEDDSDSDLEMKRNRLRDRERRRGTRSPSHRDGYGSLNGSSDNDDKYKSSRRRESRSRRDYSRDIDSDSVGDHRQSARNRSSHREKDRNRDREKYGRYSRKSYRDDFDSLSDGSYRSGDVDGKRKSDRRYRDRRHGGDYESHGSRRESRRDAKRRSRRKDYGRSTRHVSSGPGRERGMSDSSDDDRLSLRSRSRSRSVSPRRSSRKY